MVLFFIIKLWNSLSIFFSELATEKYQIMYQVDLYYKQIPEISYRGLKYHIIFHIMYQVEIMYHVFIIMYQVEIMYHVFIIMYQVEIRTEISDHVSGWPVLQANSRTLHHSLPFLALQLHPGGLHYGGGGGAGLGLPTFDEGLGPLPQAGVFVGLHIIGHLKHQKTLKSGPNGAILL